MFFQGARLHVARPHMAPRAHFFVGQIEDIFAQYDEAVWGESNLATRHKLEDSSPCEFVNTPRAGSLN